MDFEKQINDAILEINKENTEIMEVVSIKLFSAIIKDSPVGNPDLWKSKPPKGYTGGSFRSNWFLTFTNPSSQYNESSIDKSGDKTIDRMVKKMDTHKQGKSSYVLTNNSPQGEEIEYYGHSSQAPDGMVRVNTMRFNQLLKQSEREVLR
jgi:hypothetical protein